MEQAEAHLQAQQEQAREQLALRIQAAQESAALLSSKVLARFFNEIEERAFKKADDLPLSDTAGRDRAYFVIHLSRKFKKTLEQYVKTGELAEGQLNELLSDPKKKSFLGELLGE